VEKGPKVIIHVYHITKFFKGYVKGLNSR